MPQQPTLAQVLLQRQQELDTAQQAAAGSLPTTPQAPFKSGSFAWPSNIPDPAGLMALLKRLGYTGSRTEDIELKPEAQSVDELTATIDAILGNR